MNKIVVLNGKKIEYILKKNVNAKSVRIVVKIGGEVAVSAPKFAPTILIERFLKNKAEWIVKKVEHFSKFEKISIKEDRKKYLKHKEEARKLINERLKYFNKFYGFKYGKITIRNQKSRWGSCSRAGNLNFNYKILFLPQEQRDYIVIHELCHLKELNHSKRFWVLVGKTMPNYLEVRKKLRGNLF